MNVLCFVCFLFVLRLICSCCGYFVVGNVLCTNAYVLFYCPFDDFYHYFLGFELPKKKSFMKYHKTTPNFVLYQSFELRIFLATHF